MCSVHNLTLDATVDKYCGPEAVLQSQKSIREKRVNSVQNQVLNVILIQIL